MGALAPVSIVIPTLDPNAEWLGHTLNSLATQSTPPDEVIIVDATPGGFPFDREPSDSGCSTCGANFVATAFELLEAEGTTARIIERDDLAGGHQSEQRRLGIAEARNEFVGRFDEDTVLLVNAHLERCVARLDADDDVVAVGCRVAPIRGNTAGKAIAKLIDGARRVPAVDGAYHTAYFVVHATHLCPDGEACFPAHRQDDQHLLDHLSEHGAIVRDDALVALTDLPTRKQARAMRMAGATAGGGLAAGLLGEALKEGR